jgi:hypothetical protein
MGIEEARKLQEALQRVKVAAGTAAEKAKMFESLANQIAEASAGTWRADRVMASDGAIVFFGRQGEVIVFTEDARILKGKIDSWRTTRDGITLDYDRLVRI